MMHIPPFLRILLHHLPDSGYARCQYIYFLFGFLTMIFHSVRRVGFHLYMAVESCVTFKPRKAPIQLIQFSRFNNQKFCKYTFLYLFRFNAIIFPVTANVNSTSCVLGSFLYSFLLNFCQFVLQYGQIVIHFLISLSSTNVYQD